MNGLRRCVREGVGRVVGVLAVVLVVAACGGTADVGVEVPDDAGAPDDAADDPDTGQEPDGADEGVDDPSAGPQPDADEVDDPCAAHEGREMDAFIELVAPVQDQVVTDEVEIVGCSNVFEATVVWWLLDGDGETLDEGFTTATCGTGCVGEFRETIPLDAMEGEPVAYLQVFSEDMSGEQDQLYLQEVMVVLG